MIVTFFTIVRIITINLIHKAMEFEFIITGVGTKEEIIKALVCLTETMSGATDKELDDAEWTNETLQANVYVK